MKISWGARKRDVRDLAAVTGSRGSSKAIPADCIPIEVCIEFERLATGANTMPLQCFAGCALLCAYGLKRWGDVLHVHGKSFDLTSESLVVETYKSKKKEDVMVWVCPRRSISGLDWLVPWLSTMESFSLPAPDFILRALTSDFRGFTTRPADWQVMSRTLHATLISLGMPSRDACRFTMHSFRHLLPSCAFQLKMPEPEVKSMGQWGKKPTIARQYDSAMLASELASKDWVLQNLAMGWRPVASGCLPELPVVPWHSGGPAPEPVVDGSPPKPLLRGVASMRRLNSRFVLKPSVRQVRNSAGFVHLYLDYFATLCKSWRCGTFGKPVLGAAFSSHPNEWDSNPSFGFCEKCYSESTFTRVAELRGPNTPQPILPIVSPSKVCDTSPCPSKGSGQVLSPISDPSSSSESDGTSAS